MPRRKGSAAVARKAMPRSADAASTELALLRCTKHLGHAARLATIATEGGSQAQAARYIVETLRALGPELRILRAAARPRKGP